MNLIKRWEILVSLPFRLFILNCLFAAFGNGLAYIAMAWVVLQHDNTVSALAVLMLCFWMPVVVWGPFCGVIADRYNKKTLLVITNLTRAILLISITIAFVNKTTVWDAYLRAFFIGTFFALYQPAAFALLRQIVPKKQLLPANALMDMAYETGNVLGMSSAGFFLALLSAHFAIIFNGILFAIAALCAYFIQIDVSVQIDNTKHPKQALWQNWRDGLRYVAANKCLIALYSAQLLSAMNFITSPILLAPFAKNILHANVAQFGLLEACLSIGIIIGGLVAPICVDCWNLKKVLFVQVGSLVILYIWFSLNSHIIWAYILYIIIGIDLAAWPLIISKAQELTESNYQGRVQASFNSLLGVLVISIYLLLYWLGDTLPLHALYILEAAIALGCFRLLWGQRKIL